MYHSAEYYWENRSAAFNFFASVPFGFTANELFAWLQHGGGQVCGTSSARSSTSSRCSAATRDSDGRLVHPRDPSLEGFRGLRYRMPGLGGEVLRRLGAIVVNVAGGEIVSSLKSGAIDGSEWVGPWMDMAIGLHQVAGYYTIPGSTSPALA
jgi:TRAP-type mannitol/chloroaromatic compound transport system substrate-binding protein